MLSAYEIQRKNNIASNQTILSELGLRPLSAVFTAKPGNKRPREPTELPPPREPSQRIKLQFHGGNDSLKEESDEINNSIEELEYEVDKILMAENNSDEIKNSIEELEEDIHAADIKADPDYAYHSDDDLPSEKNALPLPQIEKMLMAEDEKYETSTRKYEKSLPSCPLGCPAGMKNCGGRGKKWFKQELRDAYKYKCLSCGIEFTNIPGASIDTAALCASSPITFQGLPQLNTKAKVQICKKCKKPRKGHICDIDAIFSMPIPVPPLSPLP